MRRGQIEVMGFALIIVLVIIGLLLFLGWRTFFSARPPAVTDKEFATAFVSALPRVTTACGTVTSLIQHCAKGTTPDCPQPPCEYLRQELDLILRKTLDEESRHAYQFRLDRRRELLAPDLTWASRCPARSRREAPASAEIPLSPRAADTVTLTLVLCQPT